MFEKINFEKISSYYDAQKSDKKMSETYAYVKNGKLSVHHPPEGPYPIIIPCSGVELTVNGRVCNGPVPVTKEDKVHLKTLNEVQKGKWLLEISPNGLEARLKIIPAVTIYRELTDLPPARTLKLAVKEREERRSPLSLNELIQEMDKLGIVYGIDWNACYKAVESCYADEIVIAKGNPPVPGKDGRVELLFCSYSKVPVRVEEGERVDFHQRYIFTSVEAGQVIAVKHNSVPGINGTDVKGEIIIPDKPVDYILAAGEGVILSEDGRRAVAVKSGRPSAISKENRIEVSIVPQMVHFGDVDLNSGNVEFKGDIMILGNVKEGMTVKSSQNITIKNLVSHARVQAAGSIIINGNVISSTIIAGKAIDFQEEISSKFQILAKGLNTLTLAIEQLIEHSELNIENRSNGAIGSLVKFLLEGKFNYLVDTVRDLSKQMETVLQETGNLELKKFMSQVECLLIKSTITISDVNEIKEIANKALEWKQTILYDTFDHGNIIASSIQNSIVIATGDFKLTGKGCYISKIKAGKEVRIHGVVRGGEIRAGSDVYIEELGSKWGAETKVVAGDTSKVTIGHAFENTVVVIGEKVHRFDKEEKNITLRLDKEGNLLFY